MKKLLTILLLFAGYMAGAQQITYTPMTAAGYQFKYGKFDTLLTVPFMDTAIRRGTTRPGGIICYTGDTSLYSWNGLKWTRIGGVTGGSVVLHSGVDSITFTSTEWCWWFDGHPNCTPNVPDTIIFKTPLHVIKKEISGAAHDTVEIVGSSTAGQVLTSNGTDQPVTWETPTRGGGDTSLFYDSTSLNYNNTKYVYYSGTVPVDSVTILASANLGNTNLLQTSLFRTFNQNNQNLSFINMNTFNVTNSALEGLYMQPNGSLVNTQDANIRTIKIGRGTTTRGGDSLNLIFGRLGLNANTTGYWNVAIGDSALKVNTTGHSNIAIGFKALGLNTTGLGNAAIGFNTLAANTTGFNNIALGRNALPLNTTGGNNVSLGNSTLSANTTGGSNIAIGSSVLIANTTASNSIAIGNGALNSSNGGFNIAIGVNALNVNTTGGLNTSIGYLSGSRNTTGINNIFLGYLAGSFNTTDSNRVYINSRTRGTLAADTNYSPVYITQADSLSNQFIKLNGVVQIRNGAGNGKVLTSDANGYSSWQTPSVGGGGTVTSVTASAPLSITSTPTVTPNVVADTTAATLTALVNQRQLGAKVDSSAALKTYFTGLLNGDLLKYDLPNTRFINFTPNYWLTSGNTQLDRTINYIGSSDTSEVHIKQNGVDAIVIDSLKRIGIGTADPSNLVDIQKVGSGATAPVLNVFGYSGAVSSNAAYLRLGKSRGSAIGTLTATGSSDFLGAIDFQGVNVNTTLATPVRIFAVQDGTAGLTLIPGKLAFYTGDTTGAATEKMTIKASGSVGIGNVTPAVTSILDLTSTTKGLLTPRMTATQRNAISSPATGLLVYDTDSSYFMFYAGGIWNGIRPLTSNPASVPLSGRVITTDDTTTLAATAGVVATGLSVAVAANKKYRVTISLYTSCDGAGGTMYGFSGPSGSAVASGQWVGTNTTALTVQVARTNAMGGTGSIAFNKSAGANGSLAYTGYITTAGTAGTFSLLFRSATLTQKSTIFIDSMMDLEEVQ